MSEYPIDPHYVQTEDGYIITLFRLRADFNNEVSQEKLGERPAVLLVHGFSCLGTEWLIQSPDKSLPGILANEGYDCWIACQRGTRYTTGPKAHIKLSTKDKEYWDFCSDEISYYDIPAFIDYIIKETGQKSIFYVGHSLGTKVFFQLLSSRPEYNSKIKVAATLTPAISAKHCSIFLFKALNRLATWARGYSFIYKRGFFRSSAFTYVNTFLPFVPKKDYIAGWLLKWIGSQFIVQVAHPDQYDNDHYVQMSQQIPGGFSIKTLFNVSQLFNSDVLEKYDYGRTQNIKRYGQETPPIYYLGDITVPIAIFTAQNDHLITAKDVYESSKQLKSVIFYKHITEPNFFHGDFTIGKAAHRLVFQDVIQVFKPFLVK